MGLQNLAIIFIIIVLPVSLILTSYTQSQIETLDLQIKYDKRLRESTYDALKAFQLNTINSDTSDLANSKLRDIEASVNTFFNSIATNFNMSGYNKDILKEYVPALVYTMYDGYYIYSPYINTLDDTNENQVMNEDGEVETKSDAKILSQDNENVSYHQGEKISGLKPYIYYSCRYKDGDNNFVITYSLDNYITIQGVINDKWVNDGGYLLDNITNEEGKIKYRGIEIESNESLHEMVYNPDTNNVESHQYIKLNGVKYYKDDVTNKWFTILNNVKYFQGQFKEGISTAIKYYEDAYNFKQKIKNINYQDINGINHSDGYGISELTADCAVDEQGNKLMELDENGNKTGNIKFGNYKIFDFGSKGTKSIEDPDSNFNQHRLAVIRYCIEKELSIAIANYNNYTTSYANFQMPKLDETEWSRIIDNISIISFLQGLSIGGKIYNGYSIVTNNKNEEVVQEDSIYILTNDDAEYHKPNEKGLKDKSIGQGYINLDFEIKTAQDTDGNAVNYYIPQSNIDDNKQIIGSYSSIVGMSNLELVDNYYEYMANQEGKLATAYFTALGRERYGQYRTNNNSNEMMKMFKQ